MSDDQDTTISLFDNDDESKKSSKKEETKTVSTPPKQEKKVVIPPTNISPVLKEQEKKEHLTPKRHYQDIKVQNDDEQQDIDLSNSFQKLNTSDPNQYQEDYPDKVKLSMYMQNEQPVQAYSPPRYSPPPLAPVSLPPAPPKISPKPVNNTSNQKKTNTIDNTHIKKLDQSINKSSVERPIVSPTKSAFTKKKEPALNSSSSNSNKTGMNDSTLGFDVPSANKLAFNDIKSSVNSGSSSEGPRICKKISRAINKIQVQRNTNQITFYLNDSSTIKKVISQPYLQYMQKFFFYNFNVLLPMHINQILDNNPGAKIYIEIYFDFIKIKHPQKLLQFLEKSNFKLQEQKIQSTEVPKSLLKQKFESYKNIFINTIYSGKDIVQNAVKKIKGQTLTPVRILQRMFSKQIEIAEKQQKARSRLESLTGNKNIHISVYEKGGSDLNMYVLMCFRWLLGFQLTIELVKQRLSNADPVEKQKLQFLISQFTVQKQKQQTENIKTLESKILSIYSN